MLYSTVLAGTWLHKRKNPDTAPSQKRKMLSKKYYKAIAEIIAKAQNKEEIIESLVQYFRKDSEF
jgi:DNA-binding transcriptional regulator YhcF (GntR family)